MNRHTRHDGGFTLAELLAVITILVILIAMAVPAFKSMLYSSSQSLAENKLRVGLAASRELAVMRDRDSAAVFTFDPRGNMTILPCVFVGQFKDRDATGADVFRDVFVPDNQMTPIQMPGSWTVRGYTLADTVDQNGNSSGWYDAGTYDGTIGNWLFPETGFYDATVPADGDDRQTFAIRYEGGTGMLAVGEQNEMLVVSPRPSSNDRNPNASLRVDQAENLERWARRVLTDTALIDPQKRRLIGDESGDTILARTVGLLTVFDETRLAGAIGGRLDRDSGSLYQDTTDGSVTDPVLVTIDGDTGPALTDRVNAWIEGRSIGLWSGSWTPPESDARIFTIDRYLGGVVDVGVGGS
jgi:prepilin-type N-terminal cleavage/methylation domain-containing protein